MQPIQQVKKDFFETMLQGEGQIHIALRDFGVRLARLAEQSFHPIGKMARQAHRSVRQNLHALIAAQRLEITRVQLESTILGSNDLAELIAIRRYPCHKEPGPSLCLHRRTCCSR